MGSRPYKDEKESIGMYAVFGCRLPIAVVSQTYPGNAKMYPTFPPPQAALVNAAAGDKGFWVEWCSSDEVRLRQREGNPH